MTNNYAIIPAAGKGRRFGGQKKQFAKLGGKTLLERVIDIFVESGFFKTIVVVLPPGGGNLNLPSPLTPKGSPLGTGEGQGEGDIVYVKGGTTRAESVFNGFQALDANDDDIVLIHDAARPLVSIDLIKKVANETERKKAVIPAVTISDTVKEIRDQTVVRTLDRQNLVAVQTPQGYLAGLLKKVYESVDIMDAGWTDEAAIIESIGEKVHLIEGERGNIKITTPADLKLAAVLLTMEDRDTMSLLRILVQSQQSLKKGKVRKMDEVFKRIHSKLKKLS